MPEERKKEKYRSMSIHLDCYGCEEDDHYTWSVHVSGCLGEHDPKEAMKIAMGRLIKAIEAATEES